MNYLTLLAVAPIVLFPVFFFFSASLADVPPKELSRLWNSTSSVCFTANENQEAMAGGWMDLPELRNRCGLEGTED